MAMRWNLRTGFLWLTGASLIASHLWTSQQLAHTRRELQQLRYSTAQLDPLQRDQIGLARVPLDEPDRWQLRLWLPEGRGYELQASTLWLAGAAEPDWQPVLALPQGASLLTCSLTRTPDNRRWDLALVIRRGSNTTGRRLPLTEGQSQRFPSSGRYWVSQIESGPRYTNPAKPTALLLEHLLSADGTMLYGDRPPDRDQVGVYLRLAPVAP